MNWLISTALRFRTLVVAAAIALIVVGVRTADDVPLDVFPEFAPPRVEIQTEAPGLATEEVEALVTVPIENSLNGIPFLDHVRSKSVLGLSSVQLYFKRGSDLITARNLVNERLSQTAARLPKVVNPPVILPPLSSLSRAMKIGLSSEKLALMSNLELTRLALNSDNVSDTGMQHVCSMLTLSQLEIGNKTRISDRGLKHLWRLNRLNQFSLFSPLITGRGFSTLAELPRLSSLRLTSPALTDEAFEYLSESPSLNHLELNWSGSENASALTDTGLQLLGDKLNFRHISINIQGTRITSAGTDQLRATLKNTRLDVRE